MRVVDVNRHDLADHEAAARRRGREIENLMKRGLKAYGRFRDPRRTHDFRRLWSKLRQLEFVYRSVVLAAGYVHRLSQFVSDDVDHKFPGITNISQRIFSFAAPRLRWFGLSQSRRT